ncbi:MAG: VOC family protein [Cyclobacteriaceae bacterium]
MKLEHIAIWTHDLEKMRAFYMKYFQMQSNEKYVNASKGFSSYFLKFDGGPTRIELMHRPDIADLMGDRGASFGITHLAISVGSKKAVDQLTEFLRADAYEVIGEPRTTGDGYYESVVLDCEGNQIEITV